MSTSRQYELVYITKPDTSEQEVSDLGTQIQAIAERFGGRIENTELWGRRKLAYEIANHKEGIYVLHLLSGSGEMVKEIDRRLRVIEPVIRHMTIRVDEEMRVVERARAVRKATVQRRRLARGLSPETDVERPANEPADESEPNEAEEQS